MNAAVDYGSLVGGPVTPFQVVPTPPAPVAKAALAKALASANVEIQNPSFDKVNPHFKSKFASLAAVRNAVVPIYAKHGLSIIQDLQNVDGGVACYTTILHESGEERTFGPLVIATQRQDGQAIAAAGTYAKRVQMQAIACVVGDEDDDGESTAGRTTGSEDLKPKGTVVDPRGENRGPVDPALVNQYVERFKKAMDNPDDDVAAVDVFAIHNEVSANHDLYIAIGDALSERYGPKYKTSIHKFVANAKKRGKAA